MSSGSSGSSGSGGSSRSGRSGRSRGKAAFVPWLAALVMGTTAHVGWLVHSHDERPPAEPATLGSVVNVDMNVDVHVDRGAEQRSAEPRRAWGCRGGPTESGDGELEDETLGLWIQPKGRYTFTIDRRAVERIAAVDLERLGGAAASSAIGLGPPIELRNIRAGTPLFLLGLRNGDRFVGIESMDIDEASLARFAVVVHRRGRAITLVYEVV